MDTGFCYRDSLGFEPSVYCMGDAHGQVIEAKMLL